MAVEIPVVVDINKAFQDAAKNVDTAIKPLQREVSQNALELEIKIGIDENGDAITTTFREIKEGSIHELSTLQAAISDVRMEMIAAAKAGDQAKFTSLLEAKVYMEDMVRASQTLRLEMDGVAKTMSGLNARMSAARENLNNTRINSAEWRAAVKEIQNVTIEMDKAQRKMSEMGTKAGSIDRINLKIRELSQQWDAMSRSQKFDKEGNLSKSAQKVVEKYRALTEEASRFGKSLEATARGARKETEQLSEEVKEVNIEMDKSNSRIATLIKNSLRLVAIHASATFVRNIREVTAEFELQRVALGSIIQDTERAESLFKQIKAAAVESPFEIKDLVTYTKQLSAYQIETEKLFDTTKKLADISSGLGVDMGRLILAFGQVRAAAVLRGQELRQFTEAGIPLVDKLAEKFSELNGRAVSTAEVFELISKRAVPFSMIEDIFNDLTSAGGAFYKMQEKQAETLLGQWNNLKDSISIMYDEIGNTAVVHSAMETLIRDAKFIMQNWRQVADVVKVVGIQYGVLKIASLFLPTLTKNTKLLEKAEIAEARAKELSNRAHGKGVLSLSAKMVQNYAKYTKLAAEATTQWGRGINQLKAFFTGNWLSMVLTLVGLLVAKIIAARNEAQRLNKELSKIGAEGSLKMEQSVRNFEKLAKSAVEAADGSREQKEAVDELIRTYGDILPPSDQLIGKLKEMEGNYNSVTEAIRQKINMQIREQKIDEITSEYSSKVSRKRDSLKKFLKERGLSSEEISTVLSALQSAVDDGLIKIGDSVEDQAKAIEKIVSDYTGKYIKITRSVYSQVAGQSGLQVYQREQSTKLSRIFSSLIGLYSDMNDEIQEVGDSMEGATGVMGLYRKEWNDLQEDIAGFGGIGETKFEKNESKIRNRVERSIAFLQEKFNEAGIDISSAIVNGTPNFKVLEKIVNDMKASPAQASLRTIIADFRKEYEKLQLDDDLRNAIKSKLVDISESTGISMDKFTSYIKAAGEDGEKYLTELSESIEKYRKDAKELANTMSLYSPAQTEANRQRVAEYNEMADALQILFDWLSKIIQVQQKPSNRSNYLQEIRQKINDITDAYKKYLELRNYMGKGDALSNIDILFPSLEGWEPTYENMVSRLEGMLTQYRGDADATRIIEQAIANIKFDKLKTDMDNAIKKLADEIKQSETAKRFFDDIFQTTGDREIATSLTMSVYGNVGDELEQKLRNQLSKAFVLDETALASANKTLAEANSDVARAILEDDYTALAKYLDHVTEANKDNARNLLKERMDANAAWYKNFIQTYQKARTYQERIDTLELRRTQALEDAAKKHVPQSGLDAVNEYYNREIAKVQLEAMKDTYTWTKAFEDLDGVSNQTLNNLIDLIDEYIEKYGKDLEPQQLKELARQRESAKQQLNSRNAYKATGKAIEDFLAAQNRANELQKEGKEDSEDYARALDDAKEAIKRMGEAFAEIESEMNSFIESTKELMSVFASDDDTSYFGEQLDNIAKTVRGLGNVGLGAARVMIGDFSGIVQMIQGVGGVISGIFGGINAAKLRRINRQIEYQQDLLDGLERSYERLEKAIAKSFGSDYIYNYNKQLDNLAAKQAAYEKQAQLEREKGKKADEEKIKDYENSARDTAENIATMQGQLAEHFAGTDLTSAARDFATSWVDAYREFSSTTDAMKEKFQDMIQNMIVESLAAKLVEEQLGPIFDMIDRLSKDDGILSAKDIADIAAETDRIIPNINNSLSGLMNSFASLGYNIRQGVGSFTGISRNIAGASEESINGLAAGINTQNFYMSLISQNVAAILASMTGQEVSGVAGAAAPTDPYKDAVLEHMSLMPFMHEDIYAIRSMLEKVIRPNGTTATHYVATRS